MARKAKVFRPYLDDVERLSHGKGAKKQRGTGSRMVCHRLNQDERTLYELTKQRDPSFLTVRGTGYRKNRKGSPLCNIFRQRCDALEELCVIVEKRADLDRVAIDFSTLRVRNDDVFVTAILENVLKAKYFDLYVEVMKNHCDIVSDISRRSDNDDDGNNKNNGLSSSAASVIRTPIHWEDVKTKAIWCVDKRLITIPCERDIAKSLAIDVLKESSNFIFDDVDKEFADDDDDDDDNEEEIEGQNYEGEIERKQDERLENDRGGGLRDAAINNDNAIDDNDDIDWDDI